MKLLKLPVLDVHREMYREASSRHKTLGNSFRLAYKTYRKTNLLVIHECIQWADRLCIESRKELMRLV